MPLCGYTRERERERERERGRERERERERKRESRGSDFIIPIHESYVFELRAMFAN